MIKQVPKIIRPRASDREPSTQRATEAHNNVCAASTATADSNNDGCTYRSKFLNSSEQSIQKEFTLEISLTTQEQDKNDSESSIED